jgi:RecA-family ATPase
MLAGYLVEGLIQEGSDCVLYADKQSLKSFIALDIGLSVATGTKALESFAVKRPGIVITFGQTLDHARASANGGFSKSRDWAMRRSLPAPVNSG